MNLISLEAYAEGLRRGRDGKKPLRERSIAEYLRFARQALIAGGDLRVPLRAAKSDATWHTAFIAVRRYAVLSGMPDPKEQLAQACPKPTAPRRMRRPVPEESLPRVLAATGRIDDPQRSFMVLLLLSGLRLGDLLGVTRQQIEALLVEGEVVISEKGGHERLWAPDEAARDVLANLSRMAGWTRLQDLWAEHWKTAQNRVRRLLAEICEAAGVSYANPHRFRHSFATDLSAQGTPLSDIQHMMGHASVQTTAKYVHPTGATMRRESDKRSNRLLDEARRITEKASKT